MKNKACLICLSEITRDGFFNNPVMLSIRDSGASFDFQKCYPLDTKTAFTYLLTGGNPGESGFLDLMDLIQLKIDKGYERDLLSLLQERGFSVESKIDGLPMGDADFSLIYLNNFQLIGDILEYAKNNFNFIFIVAPVFKELTVKGVDLNSFLKEKGIIETDSKGAIIWERSLACQKESGHLWINLVGRDPEGAVLPGKEYEEVRDALIEGITKKMIDNENGRQPIEKVLKKEELFYGQNIAKMPDLIVLLKEGYGFINESIESLSDINAVSNKKCHIYTAGGGVVYGENINRNHIEDNIAISSIAPSIFYCLGSTVPSIMAEKVEERFFNNDYISSNPPDYDDKNISSVLSKEDESLIQDRLKGLGYL